MGGVFLGGAGLGGGLALFRDGGESGGAAEVVVLRELGDEHLLEAALADHEAGGLLQGREAVEVDVRSWEHSLEVDGLGGGWRDDGCYITDG